MNPSRETLVAAISKLAETRDRILVAIVGPPGAGKSTLTQSLANDLRDAAILPMDGFHMDNETLRQMGLFHRKGAPQTFDTGGLFDLLQKVRAGGASPVPTFDRENDRVIPGGGTIARDARIILIEGNYLLLDAPGWRDMASLWDMSIALDIPRAKLERRLIQRWLDLGLSPDAARARARDNDLVNVDLVRTHSRPADITVSSTT